MQVKTAVLLPKILFKGESKSRRLEGDYHGQRLTVWFVWKESVRPSDIERCLCAVCGNKSPASDTVSNYIRSFSSGQCNLYIKVL